MISEGGDYIAKHNEAELPVDIGLSATSGNGDSSGNIVSGGFSDDDTEVDDSMLEEARKVVVESGKASTSFLQRRLSLGYSRAARIMDMLEARGVVGPQNGSKPREILHKPAEAALLNNEDDL